MPSAITLPAVVVLTTSVLASGCCSTANRDLAACSSAQSALERERAQLVLQTDEANNARKATAQELSSVNAQLATAQSELRALQERLEVSEARRLRLEGAKVGLLTNQLDASRAQCDREVAAAQYTGRLEGANRVLASIQVAGTAEKESGYIYDDYYYSFQVRVGDSSFVAFRVQTKKEETGFGSTLSSITGLAPAVLALVPK